MLHENQGSVFLELCLDEHGLTFIMENDANVYTHTHTERTYTQNNGKNMTF